VKTVEGRAETAAFAIVCSARRGQPPSTLPVWGWLPLLDSA
jgi:hypothetical protein